MIKKSERELRIRRIFEIHKILRNRQGISGDAIVQLLYQKGYQCNERIVAADIAELRILGANISANRHKGYWYSKPFSMLDALEGIDVGATNEILAYIRQKSSDELYNKNLTNLLLNLEKEVRNPNLEENPYVQFQKVELKNINKLELYYKYIIEKKALDIGYKYFGSEEIVTICILPILLREYNNRWTLIAYSNDKKEYQNYAIDRIEEHKFSSTRLNGKTNFDAKNHFDNVIGNTVFKENKLEHIQFKILKRRAYYVDTKKWHHSQIKISEDDDSMTFSIQIIPNMEFWAKIFEHIEDLEILSPNWMVKEFINKVKKVSDRILEN